MRQVTLAATQMACAWDRDANLARAEDLVREAARQGAHVVLLQAFADTRYFCQDRQPAYFGLAQSFEGSALVARMSRLAAELDVVLPVSFFERANNAYFSALAVIDADGEVLGRYRQSHIAPSPASQAHYYFTPGDTGLRVWHTRAGCIGVGLCCDQWFPEAARIMALLGAEILLYPTAVQAMPPVADADLAAHWRQVVCGHAAANMVPVVVANRAGMEQGESGSMTFLGSSFIADPRGAVTAEADREGPGVLTATFDLAALAAARAGFGLFRQRRPDLYVPVLSLDGGDAAGL